MRLLTSSCVTSANTIAVSTVPPAIRPIA